MGLERGNQELGFLDHMLDLFSKHALIDLSVAAVGDLHVDDHHTCEDIGIALGLAVDQALGRSCRNTSVWTFHPSDG